MSGPWACPVRARRSGMKRVLPLRPVASFTAVVHWLHVWSSKGPWGSRVRAWAMKSRSSSAITGSAPSRQSAHHAARSARVVMLSRATCQKRSARSAGTPRAATSSATAASGCACRCFAVSGNRSCSSNFVGAAPKRVMSKPAISSSMLARSSTGSDDPSRAISDSNAMGSMPWARRSLIDRAPRRLDSASPCGPVSSEWCAKPGTVPPSA